jgi:sec-independent protein translocase protein TatB
MPGFGDYIFLFVLALILFGPKKMPELARQLGKLMGQFRSASNEFKMQMEEELRVSERAEQEKKVAALEAAAPPPIMLSGDTAATPPEDTAAALPADTATEYSEEVPVVPLEETATELTEQPAIAKSGELTMRPPETGVPVQSFGSDPKLDAVLSQNTLLKPAEPVATEPASSETPVPSPSDAVNALADSIPAANEGQTTHG